MKAPRVDELQEALRAMPPQAATEGFTVEELKESMGWADRWTYMSLRRWIREGLVAHVGFKRGFTINGRGKSIPIYARVRKKRKTP